MHLVVASAVTCTIDYPRLVRRRNHRPHRIRRTNRRLPNPHDRIWNRIDEKKN